MLIVELEVVLAVELLFSVKQMDELARELITKLEPAKLPPTAKGPSMLEPLKKLA